MAAAIGGVRGRVLAGAGEKREHPPLIVASSRSAVVRLAPVLAALRGLGVEGDVAGMIEGLGQFAPPTLECVGRSPADVAGRVEDVLELRRPSAVVIAGDSDAAVASAVAAARHDVPIVRVGAGQRCGDRAVRQEVNRIVLDAMAERLYADGEEAQRRLLEEGVPDDRVRRIGNPVADVVLRWREQARDRELWRRLGVEPSGYALVALQHDDDPRRWRWLTRVLDALRALAVRMPLVLSLPADTHARLQGSPLLESLVAAGAVVTGPLRYVDFLSLQATAGAVVTDSGNVQEEATLLGVRCYTLRRASECTATLTHGTNLLLGEEPEALAYVTCGAPDEAPAPIDGWDGSAGRRLAADLRSLRLV
jgi:UDP-N-acetylglucosamine 2-epimerase (non-hydrolysing)